jgi:membrane protein
MLGEAGRQAIEAMLKGAASPTSGRWSAVVGGVLLLIAALGVVVQLKDALNTIFEVEEPRGAGFAWYARVTTVACAGILALGLLLAISLVVSTGLAAFASWMSSTGQSALF